MEEVIPNVVKRLLKIIRAIGMSSLKKRSFGSGKKYTGSKDPERWGGEVGGRGFQDGQHIYTHS